MSMERAIIQVFESSPNKIFTVKEICNSFQNYYELSDFQREIQNSEYPQPRFHHEIRSILVRLEKQDIIEKLDRNMRRLKKVGN